MTNIARNTPFGHWLLCRFAHAADLRNRLIASTGEAEDFAREAVRAQLPLADTNNPRERLKQGLVLEELQRLAKLATFPSRSAKRSEAQGLQDLFARLCALEHRGSPRLFRAADEGRLDPDVGVLLKLLRSSIAEAKGLVLALLFVLGEEGA